MENFTLVNKCVNLVAKRNSGKSELCRYMVNIEKEKFDKIFVISGTEELNNFYKTFIPASNIFYDFNENWLKALMDKLKELKQAGKELKVLIIFDDIGCDAHNSKKFKNLYTKGRHFNLSVITICQYLNQISPVCRTNCDYLLMGQTNAYSVQLLADEYLFGNITKKEFIDAYHRNSTNYNFFVINCSSVEDIDDLSLIYGRLKASI